MMNFAKVRELINKLPQKDIPYADKFFNDNDWNSLRDLIIDIYNRREWNVKYVNELFELIHEIRNL